MIMWATHQRRHTACVSPLPTPSLAYSPVQSSELSITACMHPPPFASWHHLRNHALHFMCLQGAAHSGRSSSAKSAAETSAAHACARTPCSAVGSLAVPVSSVSQSILAVQRDAHISILTEKDCTICGQWHTHRYLLWHALHCIAAMRKPTPSLHFHCMHSSKAA